MQGSGAIEDRRQKAEGGRQETEGGRRKAIRDKKRRGMAEWRENAPRAQGFKGISVGL